jgi:hypothetical protein
MGQTVLYVWHLILHPRLQKTERSSTDSMVTLYFHFSGLPRYQSNGLYTAIVFCVWLAIEMSSAISGERSDHA